MPCLLLLLECWTRSDKKKMGQACLLPPGSRQTSNRALPAMNSADSVRGRPANYVKRIYSSLARATHLQGQTKPACLWSDRQEEAGGGRQATWWQDRRLGPGRASQASSQLCLQSCLFPMGRQAIQTALYWLLIETDGGIPATSLVRQAAGRLNSQNTWDGHWFHLGRAGEKAATLMPARQHDLVLCHPTEKGQTGVKRTQGRWAVAGGGEETWLPALSACGQLLASHSLSPANGIFHPEEGHPINQPSLPWQLCILSCDWRQAVVWWAG